LLFPAHLAAETIADRQQRRSWIERLAAREVERINVSFVTAAASEPELLTKRGDVLGVHITPSVAFRKSGARPTHQGSLAP
jgi:hypothetical protein